MNYFLLFSLDAKYDIDNNLLEEKYIELQKKFHPDISISKTSIDSNYINKAYVILKDQVKRAEYLLNLKNINLEDFPLTTNELQKILSIHENIENSTEIQRKDLLLQIENDITILENEISKAFEKLHLKDAASMTVRLKYMINLRKYLK